MCAQVQCLCVFLSLKTLLLSLLVVFDEMWLERLPLHRELSLLQNFPALQAEGSERWEWRRRRRNCSSPQVGIPALLLFLLSSFGNLCWHTRRCLFELLHNTPTQWERTPKGCWIAPCGFPFLFLSRCSVVRRAMQGRKGQYRLGIEYRLISSWGLDWAQCCTWKHWENGHWIFGSWIRSDDLICLSEDKGSLGRREARWQSYRFKLCVFEGA